MTEEYIEFEKFTWGLDTRSDAEVIQDNFPGFEPEMCEMIAGNTDSAGNTVPELMEALREKQEEIKERWSRGGQEPYTCELVTDNIEYLCLDELHESDKEKLDNINKEDDSVCSSGSVSEQ